MQNKVLLIATVQSHICQFHKPLVKMLHDHGYEVHVAARNNLAEKNGLKLDFVDKIYDFPFARSPLSMSNLKAFKMLKNLIDRGNYEVIHCNTPVGGILTRLASLKARRYGAKVIYTAHGFHFYEGAPLKNWVIFYPIEKLFSYLTDCLITITDEDDRLAKRRFTCNIRRIHGVGVDPQKFHPIKEEEVVSRRVQEGLDSDDYVILCVGELRKNKNQAVLIKTASVLKKKIPNLKILLAGNGPMQDNLEMMIAKYHLEDTVVMLGYRPDLYQITPIADLIVSCSYREGMPLNIIEGMLCKKPVIASINRGHKELVSDGDTGYLFKPDDAELLAKRIYNVIKKPSLARRMGDLGYQKAQKYSNISVYNELEEIYLELCSGFSEVK